MSVPGSSTYNTTREPISICWKSVFAGVLLALAVAWIMYLFGGALGVSLIDPYDQDPVNGLGYGAAAWIFLTWLVSLFLGGLLAGRLSEVADRASGMVHGVVVWSVCIVLTIMVGVMGVSSLLQMGGSVIKGTTTAAMYAVSDNKNTDNAADITPKGVNTLSLENDIKQQISQAAGTSLQGQSNIDSQTVQKSINQLNNNQLMQAAGYLLQGNTDAAKNVIALNTDLSVTDINRITDNLSDKVEQYKQNIKAYTDKATDYTAAVLWMVLISNLSSLLAAIAGGWVGIYTVSRVYGRKLY